MVELIVDIIYFIILLTLSYFTFFHLILWFENKNELKKTVKKKKFPYVSILVPAYNEENVIGKTLKNILQINYPKNKFEVIVIDDGSIDRTYEIAKKFESNHVKVLSKENGGKATALNFGLNEVKSEFVAVMDADTFLDKNALINSMKYFDEKKVAAVTSHILVKRKENLWEKLQNIELMVIALMRKAQERMNIVNATPGPFSVYNRKIILEVGKFDEKNLIEDVEIAWRLLKKGYKIKMAFDAMAYSIYPDNFKTWLKQRLRWGIGGIQTLQKYMSSAFDKKSYGVGEFIVPNSIIGYSFTLLAEGIFFYLILTSFANYAAYIVQSYLLGINPFSTFDISLNIDVRFIYGFAMFVISLFVLRLAISTHMEKPNLLTLILFLTVYSILMPLVTLYSFYKFLRKERGWLTK